MIHAVDRDGRGAQELYDGCVELAYIRRLIP